MRKYKQLASMVRYATSGWKNAAHPCWNHPEIANRGSCFGAFCPDEILRELLADVTAGDRRPSPESEKYGTFAATERVLMAAAKAGADRQEMHEIIREHSLAAWAALAAGQANPLPDRLSTDPRITQHLASSQIIVLLDATQDVGDAPQRARKLAGISGAIGSPNPKSWRLEWMPPISQSNLSPISA